MMLIIKISIPFNTLRSILVITLTCIFAVCYIYLKDLFSIMLPPEYIKITIELSIVAIFNFIILNIISNKILNKARG